MLPILAIHRVPEWELCIDFSKISTQIIDIGIDKPLISNTLMICIITFTQ